MYIYIYIYIYRERERERERERKITVKKMHTTYIHIQTTVFHKRLYFDYSALQCTTVTTVTNM